MIFNQDNSDLIGAINDEIAERKTYVRPNLLDNWYFVGGGSQAGAGKFPINQRGSQSYTATGVWSIDRWYKSDTHKLTVDSDCVIFERTATTGNPTFYQSITPDLLPTDDGEKYTFSILYKATKNKFRFCGTYLDAASNWTLKSFTLTGNAVSSATATKTQISIQDMGASASVAAVGDKIYIKALKVELGDTQTLAHQVNGAWVLNEIPDFGEQMARCRRYYQVINGNMFAGVNSSGDGYDVSVPVDVLMRAVPNATGSTLASVYIDGTQYTGTFAWTRTMETNANTSTVYTLRFSYSGGTLPATKMGRCYLYGILSAEI